MSNALKIIQVILALLLVVAVLLQQRGASLGVAFGTEGNVYRSRRGIEQTLYIATIVIAVLFCAVALLTVLFG